MPASASKSPTPKANGKLFAQKLGQFILPEGIVADRRNGTRPAKRDGPKGSSMGTALAVPSITALRRKRFDFQQNFQTASPELEALFAEATEYALNSRSKGTRDNYESAWNAQIIPFCTKYACKPYPMPPEFVAALYVYVVKNDRQKGDERTVLYLSMVRNVLSMAHRFSGHVDPTLEPQVRAVYVGLINDFGLKPKHPKVAIYPEEVARMILRNSSAENAPKKLFHNAVMATGSAGAMRSKEVSLLDLEHFKFDTRGVTIYIGQSKTDQEQVGREIYLSRTGSASCPVRSIELYQDLLPARPGPAFRTIAYNAISPTRACTRTLRRAVQQHALLLGLSNRDVGFHSLRAGFITAAIDANIPLHKIMEVTGHKSIDSLLHYYRPRLSHDNLTQAVGL